jgi:hypothetical protein
MRVIKNFPVYLHNCDAVADYHCIQIYKDFLIALSQLRHKIDKRSFRFLGEGEKRERLSLLLNYFLNEGLVSVDADSGRILVAREDGEDEFC